MMLPAAQRTLVGREAQCGRIAGLLASAREGWSGALVLAGDPGIGKSALCAWARGHAVGMRVLTAQGVESEVDLPFAGLSELCAGELDCAGLVADPHARALDRALRRRGGSPVDRFAIGSAVLGLLAVVAEREPVLVIVDDAQWLDPASADALLFAARRLRREGVAMLVATRAGGVFDADRDGLPRVPVEGLDVGAARALLEAAHGALPARVAEAITAGTEGNPLALLEVPRLLSEAQLAGQRPLDAPLPVGPALERALLSRLSGVPDAVRRGLLVAAASGGERVQPVLDALGCLGLCADVLAIAEEAGVMTISGERFQFHHPLLRSALYHGAPAPARRASHAALAQVTDGEARAWHLAHATVGEDEAVARVLEDAGREARLRGAPAAAASALERAARLSRPGQARVRRLREAAHDAYLTGRPAHALDLLDEALSSRPDALARADIQHLRCRILVLQGHVDAVFGTLVDEARRVRDLDAGRAAAMLADAALDCIPLAEIPRAVAVAREACDLAQRADSAVQASAMSMLASALALNGRRREAADLLDRCLLSLRAADPLSDASELVANAAQSCNWTERYGVAAELLDRLTTSARAAGAPSRLPYPLAFQAELNLRLGRWALAAAQAEEAIQLGQEMRQDASIGLGLGCLVRLAAAGGDERRCREMVAGGLSLMEQRGMELGRLYLYSALGLLELGLRRPEAAIPHLMSAAAFAQDHAVREPNAFHWGADLVEAYIRAGKLDAADDALTAFERQAQETGGRWALGTAARCRGLLADQDEADACFAAAHEQLDALPMPFEVARSHLCHGQRLRRAGRRIDARRALRLAMEGFDRLGATPWSRWAQVELRATGETPRRRDDSTRDQLTAHELQVALTVAGGASNREAAAALFLSPKTIEFHLGHIYSKLGVRTRSQLTRLAVQRGWLPAAEPD